MAGGFAQARRAMDRGSKPGGRSGMGLARQGGKALFVALMPLLQWLDRMAERFLWVAQVTIIGSIAIVGYYMLDREPPFAVLSVQPAQARPGEYITITAEVRRDAHRNCSAEFSRYVFDATRTRFDLGSQVASAEMVRAMEERSPRELRISFLVPPTAAFGSAWVETVLQYHCNKVHRVWPIEVTTRMPFQVVP